MDDRTLDNLPIEDFLHRIFDRLDDIRININSSQQAILDLTEQNNTLMKPLIALLNISGIRWAGKISA